MSSQNPSMKGDLLALTKRTSYQPVANVANAGRHSLNPDVRD